MAAHPPEKLLVNILDPNAERQPGYYAYDCRLTDGAGIFGLISAETANSITFKLPDGTSRAVLRTEIASLQSTRASLMPVGLEAALDPQKLADLIAFLRAGKGHDPTHVDAPSNLRVGAAAVNLQATDDMPLAGYLEARFTKEQEGQLRAVAVVLEKPGAPKLAIVACDVLWVTRAIVDAALAEIERTTGIPSANVLVNATHTHHAPGTAPAHAFGWSEKFADEVRRGIVQSVQDANARMADAAFYFQLGEERTVGANSRLLLEEAAISWLNPLAEAGEKVQPTGPFDPQLPVLDFRAPDGKSRALIFNHSTHTIGTRSGKDVRSPSFYGLAAQDLESSNSGVLLIFSKAPAARPTTSAVCPFGGDRANETLRARCAHPGPAPPGNPAPRAQATIRVSRPHFRRIGRSSEGGALHFRLRRNLPPRISEIFATMRRELAPQQGQQRTTTIQAMLIGDVAIVGVPADTSPLSVSTSSAAPLFQTPTLPSLPTTGSAIFPRAKATPAAVTRPGPASTATPSPVPANVLPTKP